MSEQQKRWEDTERNLILNRALDDLEQIINGHDPEVDVPIKDGVWNRLDEMALEIEARRPAPTVEQAALLLLENDALSKAIYKVTGGTRPHEEHLRQALSDLAGGSHE